MIVRSWVVLALLAAVPCWSGAVRAQGSAPLKSEGDVAVLPLELVGNVPAGRPALEAAVVRGLALFTGTTVEATQTSARLIAAGAKLPCEDADCWTAAGKAAGARHLIAGKVERKGANFEVQFRLFDGGSGRLLATETNKCEAADCSVAELTRQTVRELARTALSGSGAPAGAGGTAASPGTSPMGAIGASEAMATGESPAPAPAASVESTGVPDSGSWTPRRILPYLAIASGVGTMGAGAWLIKRDGSCAEPVTGDCNTWRETMWEGVTITGVGAALLATGVVVAITDHQDARDRTVVLIGPRSLLLRGRF